MARVTDETASGSATAKPRRARPPRGLAQKLGSIILAFEAIVVGLAGLTVFGLKALGPGIEPWWGIVGGAVVGVAMLVAAGLMGSRAGIVMGWILQVIVLLSAILVPAILLVAIVFGGMWAYAMIVGGRADRAARSAGASLPSAAPAAPDSSTDTPGNDHRE
ncbi:MULTISPECIES: DUF4233 domain-containing protein [Microbacterium]|uniref:DUF4233 domain-containing protein n=1 Tax=Microbacterium azadirachtae TaxID=582680 RepID=A0A0F0LKA8_9MICO|nr:MULTISPECIES: DUF4233 domain-containing protein [Microbacterium]KJL32700.1 hypothetical protein RS86_02481 [Microbacterium azadirachtae]PRB08020.1 DUF4233 domain-containing protein [Microbacterium sp. MYb64]